MYNDLDYLLELDGIRYVIDEYLGLWVKFDIQAIEPSENRPHGIKYSLTLHDRKNIRILGFDNSHTIKLHSKEKIEVYDHWHKSGTDKAKIYHYKNAGKLIEDFWKEVAKIQKNLEEQIK